MPVLRNIGLLATCRNAGPQDNIHPVYDAAVAWTDDTIRWVGHDAHLPKEWMDEEQWDAGGALVTPGLVDCHTHLAFGGWRSNEFEARLRGKTYLEIAHEGGGIASTVEMTRAATVDELVHRCEHFIAEMVKLGVTTIEAKSGYGLTVAAELKQLRVYQTVNRRSRVTVVPTFLAHIIPREYADDRSEYVKMIQTVLLPEIAKGRLATFCDVFVEKGAFTRDEARSLFDTAKSYGMIPKIHADQFEDSGGAMLAAESGAISADHLESISKEGISALSQSATIAVSLPIAALYLGLPPAPARSLVDAGVPVAVATDFNPGSAPSYHLHLAMTLACIQQRMTPNEVLRGVTSVAADAIGLGDTVGSIEVGKLANMIIIDADTPAHWMYHFQPNAVRMTVAKGEILYRA